MIPYVQSVASQEVPPPYQFPGVQVHGFVWEAHIDRVQAYCDHYFNLGDAKDRGFTYVAAAAWPYAQLLILDYPVMISASQKLPQGFSGLTPFSDRGVITQREVFIALPVLRMGTTPLTLLTQTTLECALPFLLVDDPNSAVCGREMLGLEKLRALILLGESTFPDSFQARVSLPGWRSGGSAKQQMLPFLDIDTGPAAPTFRGSPDANSLWTLLRSRSAEQLMDGLATGTSYIDTMSAGIVPTAMQTVSLKQFRDAAQPERALYQALVSCRSKYSRISNLQFFKEDDVNITFHEEGSFGDTLRFVELPPGNPTGEGASKSFHPKVAYRFTADIDFDHMLTLHTFSVDRPGLPPTKPTSDLIAPWLRPWRGLFLGQKPR